VATGRYYLDTSAYLCVLLGEAGWERIAREIENGHLPSSVLLALEVERTLVQLSRGGRLSPPDLQAALDRLSVDLGQFVLRDLTLDLCRSRVMPIVSTPRSLDLAHLRTALWFHEQEVLTRFVSLDTGQVQGAREPDCRCRRGSHAVTSDPIRRLGMGGGDRPLRMASGGSRSRLGLRPAIMP
jgi:hypothetical protein